MLANWQRECTMEDILMQLKKEMTSPQNRKLAQPPEGVLILFLIIRTVFISILAIAICMSSVSFVNLIVSILWAIWLIC